MQLFKRLLLSYFPDTISKDPINPASLFVSFISSKDFFSIINRRIVENYKLNLFDIAQDPFEFKMGIGEETPSSDPAVMDRYYGYLATANLNGYKFYNPANTANALVLASSLYLSSVFEEEDHKLFVDCLYAFYLLSFLFVSRIKVFPGNSVEEDFNWFVDLFFNFYGVVVVQLKHKVSEKHFLSLKKKLLGQVEILFLLFHYYRRLNQMFVSSVPNKDYFHWLFGDMLSPTHKQLLQQYPTSQYTTSISLLEEDILFELAPADIHLKYLFLENNPHDIAQYLVASLYDKNILDKKLSALLKDPKELDFIIDYLTDIQHFKRGYFQGIQKFMMSVVRSTSDEEMEEFDQMMSEIGDDIEQIDEMKIPARLKKESMTMEQLLNFYITFLGGLSIERADSFFLRMFKPALLDALMEGFSPIKTTPESIHFYGLQQFFYSKNTAFYAYANKSVRSGREKFYIPLSLGNKTIRSNVFSLSLFDEMALVVLLQDMNPKINKLYVKNTALLDWFQEHFSSKISVLLKEKKSDFVKQFYAPVFSGLEAQHLIPLLQEHVDVQDIIRLKDALYSFDFWLFDTFIAQLSLPTLKKHYTDQVIMSIFALLRDLLPGFLLYYHFLLQKDKKQKKSTHPEVLKEFFILEILGIQLSLYPLFDTAISCCLAFFSFPFSLFIEFDDNKDFFAHLWENWKKQSNGKTPSEFLTSFNSEDLLRIRGVMKHISYYNKRYLLPLSLSS